MVDQQQLVQYQLEIELASRTGSIHLLDEAGGTLHLAARHSVKSG